MVDQTRDGPFVQVFIGWIFTSAEYLMEEKRLRDFIDDLVKELDMTVIMPTVGIRLPIKRYTDIQGRMPSELDYGYSLVTMISESHIALHTWPHFDKAFLEIVSCCKFEPEKVKEVIMNYFLGCKIDIKRLDM